MLEPSENQSAEFIVLIDGLGWRFAERYGFVTWASYRQPLRTVLGFSSTAVPSLLSGLSPEEHGAWTLYFRDEANSPFAWTRGFRRIPFETIPKLRWRFREWLDRETRRRASIRGYFALYDVPLQFRYLFDVAWRDGLFDADAIIPTFLDGWRSDADSFLGAYPDTDAVIMQHAEEAAAAGKRRIFCYLNSVDARLHEHALKDDSAVLRAELESVDAWIRQMISLLEARHGVVSFACFSDHGMTPVTREIDLRGALAGLKLGRDYLCFLDSTMARFWGAKPVLGEIRNRLEGLPGRQLTTDDLSRERLPIDPRRFGDMIWLADPGVCIAPSWMSSAAPEGMHGYIPSDPWSDGVLLTNYAVPTNTNDVVALGRHLMSRLVA